MRKRDPDTVQIIWNGELKSARMIQSIHRATTPVLPTYDFFYLMMVDGQPILVPELFVFTDKTHVLRQKKLVERANEPAEIEADGQPVYPEKIAEVEPDEG